MESHEQQVLLQAQKDAKRILDDSRDDAERVMLEAHKRATQLLLSQQETAGQLLLQLALDVNVAEQSAEEGDSALSQARRDDLGDQRRRQAEFNLEIQRRAAELLLTAQSEAASTLGDAVARAASDSLIRGQKEAAAVLLAARMSVLDGREKQGRLSNE